MASGFTMGATLRDPSGAQTGLAFPSVATAAGGRFGPNLRVATPAPAIDHSLTATLDGRSYSCGALTAIAVPAGTDVFPCCTVENTPAGQGGVAGARSAESARRQSRNGWTSSPKRLFSPISRALPTAET